MNSLKKFPLPYIIVLAGLIIVAMALGLALIKTVHGDVFVSPNAGKYIGSVKYSFVMSMGDNQGGLIKPSGNDTNFTNRVVTTYEEYNNYFSKLSDGNMLTEKDFEKNNYYIFRIKNEMCSPATFTIKNLRKGSVNGDTLTDLYVKLYYVSEVCDYECKLNASDRNYFAIKLDKSIKKVSDFDYDASGRQTHECDGVWKPMIYLYPEKDMNVSVKLANKELLTTTYPKYNDGWNVYAKKDGTLLLDNREYYGLYWEGANHKVEVKEDGFVVKGEDTAKFLEEKLAILGLTEREANEMIVYWLPKMEHNKYNYIRFETKEEIDKYMPMEVSPKPDTVIRVYLNYKALDEKIDVKEQHLTKANRKGFTVVEWGGSIIK